MKKCSRAEQFNQTAQAMLIHRYASSILSRRVCSSATIRLKLGLTVFLGHLSHINSRLALLGGSCVLEMRKSRFAAAHSLQPSFKFAFNPSMST